MVSEIFQKNRKGWIRIVEVFVAMLLMTGILFVILEGRYLAKMNSMDEVYEAEITILRDVELNNNLRSEILNANLPVEEEDFGTSLPNTETRINELVPADIECEAKLCELTEVCVLNDVDKEHIYAEAVVIAADVNTYNPRQLKLFCWKNEV